MDGLFISLLLRDPFYYFSWVGVLAFSICVHECAHAYVALKLGDDTAARGGHLSLNPAVQMGLPAVVFLLLCGIGWGSVPVSPANYRKRGHWAAVALAGPLSNLLLAFAFGLVMIGCSFADDPNSWLVPLAEFAYLGSLVNCTFFIYNLLPIPIFDGWSVFSYFFPAMEKIEPHHAQQAAMLALVVVFLTPVGDLIWRIGQGLTGAVLAACALPFSPFF